VCRDGERERERERALLLTFDNNRNIISGSVSGYTQIYQQVAVVKTRESLYVRKQTLRYYNRLIFNPVNSDYPSIMYFSTTILCDYYFVCFIGLG